MAARSLRGKVSDVRGPEGVTVVEGGRTGSDKGFSGP